MLLRFSAEELREILVYGRPGTPMPAWGAEGGGPLTTQQIDELIAYVGSIQLTADEANAEVEGDVRTELGLGDDAEIDWNDPATGQAMFNLGLENGFAGGAYAVVTQTLAGFEHHQVVEVVGTEGSARAWWSGAMDRGWCARPGRSC